MITSAQSFCILSPRDSRLSVGVPIDLYTHERDLRIISGWLTFPQQLRAVLGERETVEKSDDTDTTSTRSARQCIVTTTLRTHVYRAPNERAIGALLGDLCRRAFKQLARSFRH